MNWTLKGKRALVTGGTKGIGRAVALEFLNLGAEVTAVARGAEGFDDLRSSAKGALTCLQADLSTPEGRALVIKEVTSASAKLDILVNNVGTNLRKKFVEYSEAEYRRLFEANLFSTMEVTQKLYPLLKASGRASVINMASVAGTQDVQSGPPYGMTKAAIIQFTRHLAAEWATDGIRVNAISPWYIDTPLTQPVLTNPDRLKKILERTPMGRIGTPEEVASLAAYLAMDLSSYLTGQNIQVDGGMAAKGL